MLLILACIVPCFCALPYPPPFSLAPSPDEIRLCSACGKQIITWRRTVDGEIVSRLPVKVTFDEDQKLFTAEIAALNRPRETRLRRRRAED